MRNLNTKPDLDAYLRLSRATVGEWQAAVRELLHCEEVVLTLERPQGIAGSLSSLSVDRGVVCAVDLVQGASVHLCGLPGALLVVPVSGQCDVLVDGEWRPSVLPMVATISRQSIAVRACDGARADSATRGSAVLQRQKGGVRPDGGAGESLPVTFQFLPGS